MNRALMNAKRGKWGEEEEDALRVRKKYLGGFIIFFFDAIKVQLVFDGFLQVLHRPG